MGKAALIFASIFLFAAVLFGQVIKPATSSTPAKPTQAVPKVTEIDSKQWSSIVKALDDEDWGWATSLIRSSMAKLTADNEKKQLAQLRYFYLYSLAGKASKNILAYPELEKAVAELAETEFLFPARKVLADCTRSVNHICPVKSNDSALRMTATNKSVSQIHSFEYVELPNAFNIKANNGRKAYVSAYLKRAEFNPRKSDTWIMRLYFNGGQIDLTTEK